MKKRTFAILLTLLLLLGLTACGGSSSPAPGGRANGTTATAFSPKDPVTRAQFVTFLYRELGQTAD